MINLPLNDFLHVMRTWGADEIRITSTLRVAQNIHQEPGPVIFDPFDLGFCWRQSSNGKESPWECTDSIAWSSRLPSPQLP